MGVNFINGETNRVFYLGSCMCGGVKVNYPIIDRMGASPL